MSIKVIDEVLDSAVHRGASRLVLIAIANYADENGFAWPSLDTIAAKANVSKRSTIRAIERLEDDGALFVMRRRNAGNAYIVLTDHTLPLFRAAIGRLLSWTRLEISDILTLNLRAPSKERLQSLTLDSDAISDNCAAISDICAEISDTVSLESVITVNNRQSDQSQTPVSPAAVPSESDNGPVRSESHHYTDAELQAFENERFRLEMESDSRRLNAQPQKHISAEERMAATKCASARGWAKRTSSKQPTHPLFEKALERYGDEAPALRALQEQININFGLAPDWSNKRQVKWWTDGLHEAWVASREDYGVIVAAGKYLREKGLPMASPRSLTKMALSIAAERATAHVAPSARAVREYV